MPQDTLYTKFCGVPKSKVAICPNVGWFKDFFDPQSMIDADVQRHDIIRQGNVNWPQLERPDDQRRDGQGRARPVRQRPQQAWANDRQRRSPSRPPSIPWIWDKTALINSKDVNGVASDYFNAHWDLAFSSLK